MGVVCLHLGPEMMPPSSTCIRVSRHYCEAKDKPVRPGIECEACRVKKGSPFQDRDAPEAKRPA